MVEVYVVPFGTWPIGLYPVDCVAPPVLKGAVRFIAHEGVKIQGSVL